MSSDLLLVERARTSAAGGAEGPRTERLEFRGSGAEYFRIWIVNLALTIVTLGVFSAWAKVRTKRYFYGNTLLDGSAFDYTANPISILVGRLVMVAAVLVYTLAGYLAPGSQYLILVLAVPIVPWVVNRALAFNNRYSAHRGLRFGFDGRYWPAFRAFVAWPALGLVTFGLAWPLAAHRSKRYIVENSRFGRNHFAFGARVSAFYTAYVIATGLVFVLGLLFLVMLGGTIGVAALLGAQAAGSASATEGPGLEQALQVALVLGMSATYVIMIVLPTAYVQTAVTNHLWRTSRLQRDGFDMRMRFWRVAWIQLSNLALILLTAGLFIPFAKVRITRYRIESLSCVLREAPRAHHAGRRDRVGAAGDELGNAFDLDLGL